MGQFLQENRPRSSEKDLLKYASSARVRASKPVATPAHRRNHIGVFGKGVPTSDVIASGAKQSPKASGIATAIRPRNDKSKKGSPRDIRFLKIILPPITELLQ